MLIPFGVLSAAAGGAPVGAGDYELIATEILGSSQSSVVFSNLGDYSSTYKHLQIRYLGRSERAVNIDGINAELNGDTGSNYAWHQLFGNGSSVGSGASASTNKAQVGWLAGSSQGASQFLGGVIDFLDVYAAKNKTIRSLNGIAGSGSSGIQLSSAVWLNTNSLTSITLKAALDNNLVSGSRFSLYGIKGE